jgi:hypothetical protein
MKRARNSQSGRVFLLSPREHALLLEVLRLYPLVPTAHHRLSRAGVPDDNQRLLDEALAEHREENRRQLDALLREPGRFKKTGAEIQLTLRAGEVERLLQALNDVRVGSWLAIGEPDEHSLPTLTSQNLRLLLALEVSGHFQSEFLAAMGLEASDQWR